jgi:c(7)-type cytochrome triheme protein
MKIIAAVAISLALLFSSIAFAKVGGGDIVFEVKKEKVTFSHDSHVKTSGLACQECHDKLFVTKAKHKKASMADMGKGKSCGACHDGKRAFSVKSNCGNCHQK